MPNKWVLLTGVLSLGFAGALQAHPLDSPDIVYIDGMPCNSACQSYMAWSRQTTPMSGQPQPRSTSAAARQRPPKSLANRAIAIHEAGSKPATSVRATKQSTSKSPEIPRKKNMDLRTAGKAGASFDTPVANDAGALPRVGIASRTRSIRQQLTPATVDPKESEQKTFSDHSEAVLPSDSQPNEPLLSNDTDPRTAILLARPEIKSVSDLAGKNIAIEDKLSTSVGVVQIAIAAAGAAGVQLAASPTKALDRVIDGQVSAAVLMLAYPEAAETFPEIAGYNIFRIPLTPERSRVKRTPLANATGASDPTTARTGDLRPTDDVATGSHTRKTQELITAAIAVVERMTTAATADPQGSSAARSNDADPRIAILIARPEIKSLSDLAGKKIAIDDKQSSSSTNVRTAIASVAGVQVSEGQTEAIDQLISGEVSAAVLTSASREAAEAFPEIAGFSILRISLTSEMPRAKIAESQPAIKPATEARRSAAESGGAVADDLHKKYDLVMAATAVAERMSVAVADPQGAELTTSSTDRSDRSATALSGAPSADGDPRIAILMAQPDIKSVSDLAGKEIAINDEQSASSGKVRTAIAAAGATQVQVIEGQTKAINRLILAEVPAAVLTLVSPEAAEGFPEVAGFRIFRIPLSPRSVGVGHP